MRRLLLLAIGVSAVVWTAIAGTGSVPPGTVITMAQAGPCMLEGDSSERGDSDQHWRAQHHAIAAATESVWKSALVHADLAAARTALPFDTTRAASSPDPPACSAPPYLRHTPLLI